MPVRLKGAAAAVNMSSTMHISYVFMSLGALGAPSLGLPVVVARAELLISIGAGGHAQARRTAFLAKEQAWLLVLRRRAPSRASTRTFCTQKTDISLSMLR